MDSFILHCSTRQYLLQHLALWPYNSQIAAAELHGCAAASVLQTLQACANSLHESAVAAEHNFALLLQRAQIGPSPGLHSIQEVFPGNLPGGNSCGQA